MAISIGTLLKERYRIVSVLGQGGMGAVYQAIDELLNIQVAVKENLFLADEYTKQFQQEAKILASLKHPCLPRVIDFYRIKNQAQYLIMDYIEGQDLRDRILELGRLSEHDVGLIGYYISDALNYMHEQKPCVIHRDIKPGNIKITKDNKIFLVDFGLAKAAEYPSQVTVTGARAMTPGFSPPEQYGTARTDVRSDIYSLGATLYNSLTGVIPEDALNRITEKLKLTPILDHRDNTEQKLVAVIEKAMRIDPEDRFQNATSFQTALLEAVHLQNVSDELSILSRFDSYEQENKESQYVPEIIAPVSQKRKKRKSSRLKIMRRYSLATLIAVIIIGISFFPNIQNNIQDIFNQQKTSVPTESAFVALITSTQPSTATIVVSSKTKEEQKIQTATIKVESVVKATSTILVTKTPSESADTRKTSEAKDAESEFKTADETAEIVFASNRSGDFQLWMMNVDGSNQHQLTDMAEGACQADWSPDGKKIVFISPCRTKQDLYLDSVLYIYDFQLGSVISLMPSVMGDRRIGNFEPSWSPFGDEIAFTSASTGISHIYIYNIATNEINEISSSPYPDRHASWHPDGQSLLFVRNRVNWVVWSMGKDGNNLRQLSWSGDVSNSWPIWSPDKNMINYSQNDESGIPWLVKLYEGNFGTTLEENVYANVPDYQVPILGQKFSPDGGKIIFESWPDGRNHDIYIMDVNGDNLLRLTTHPDYDFGADWQP